jgi:hypothetical protein
VNRCCNRVETWPKAGDRLVDHWALSLAEYCPSVALPHWCAGCYAFVPGRVIVSIHGMKKLTTDSSWIAY